jgi:hypothetical protein
MNYVFLAILPMLAGLIVWALDDLIETIRKEKDINK